MRHNADCWIAASAMAAGVSYEEAENTFGAGVDYSEAVMNSPSDPIERRMAKMLLFIQQFEFFQNHGCYALFIPSLNPQLRHGRRYLLSGLSGEKERPWMAHLIVVDEDGKVFDPDPRFAASEEKGYPITEYHQLAGWEIIKWAW